MNKHDIEFSDDLSHQCHYVIATHKGNFFIMLRVVCNCGNDIVIEQPIFVAESFEKCKEYLDVIGAEAKQ